MANPDVAQLESIARDQPEQHAMPARPEGGQQPDDRLGAARPPAVGHEVEDGERPRRAHASSSP